MMRSLRAPRRLPFAAPILAAVVTAQPLAGQVHVAGDAALESHYVWRGVTRRNAFVWQPSLLGAYRFGRAFVSGGAWTNVELTRADVRIDEDLGLGARFGEFDYWLEAMVLLGDVEAAAGATLYRFPNKGDAAFVGNVLFDTEEVYGRLAWRPGWFAFMATAWYDVGVVDGLYGEIDASVAPPVLPIAVPILRVGGTLGFNSGQDGQPALGYFDASGVTHVALYVQPQVSLPIAGLELYTLPTIRVQFNVDEATKRQRGDEAVGAGDDVRVYFGMSFSWHAGQ